MPGLKFAWIAIIVVVLVTPFQPLNAGWTKLYGGEGSDKGRCVQQTTDGGYIVTGQFSVPDGEFWKTCLWLVRVNEDGDTVWTRTYGYYSVGCSVQQTSDGGYIIAGFTYTDNLIYELWLLKTDNYGDTVWTRTYEVGSSRGYSVEQTEDNGYVVTGNLGGDVGLIKTDSLGDSMWTKTYGTGSVEKGFFVRQTYDGGYIVTGERNYDDIWLLKMDSVGDTLWTRTYGGRWIDHSYCVQQTSDSGYVIVGDKTIDSTDAGIFIALWLIKTDSNGDTVWTKTYGGEDFGEWGRYVEQTTDGGYIITGLKKINGWGLWLLKTDSLGDTLWTRTYGDGVDHGWCVRQTTDGGYIITGVNYSDGDPDLWLIKTDANGDTLAVVEEPIVETSDWEVVTFVGSQIVLHYTNRPEGFHASVFDAIGRKVDELHSDGVSGTITWGESMSSGVYFIRSTDEFSGNNTARVVIIH